VPAAIMLHPSRATIACAAADSKPEIEGGEPVRLDLPAKNKGLSRLAVR